jgi:F-type H+-transporting ATPase subunit b
VTGPHSESRGCQRACRLALALLFAALLVADPAAASGDGDLVLVPDAKMLILIGLFVALMFPANALLFKPIFRVLDEREARTSGTRDRAQKLQREAIDALTEYERAVREVREEAEGDRKQTLAEARGENGSVRSDARGEAKREVERARGELTEALAGARSTLRAQAEALAEEAAARVLGRPL